MCQDDLIVLQYQYIHLTLKNCPVGHQTQDIYHHNSAEIT